MFRGEYEVLILRHFHPTEAVIERVRILSSVLVTPVGSLPDLCPVSVPFFHLEYPFFDDAICCLLNENGVYGILNPEYYRLNDNEVEWCSFRKDNNVFR